MAILRPVGSSKDFSRNLGRHAVCYGPDDVESGPEGPMSGRFEVIDAKVDRHFVWLMGMMVTGFITVVGALVGVVYR